MEKQTNVFINVGNISLIKKFDEEYTFFESVFGGVCKKVYKTI